jgi:hypothetical protein
MSIAVLRPRQRPSQSKSDSAEHPQNATERAWMGRMRNKTAQAAAPRGLLRRLLLCQVKAGRGLCGPSGRAKRPASVINLAVTKAWERAATAVALAPEIAETLGQPGIRRRAMVREEALLMLFWQLR